MEAEGNAASGGEKAVASASDAKTVETSPAPSATDTSVNETDAAATVSELAPAAPDTPAVDAPKVEAAKAEAAKSEPVIEPAPVESRHATPVVILPSRRRNGPEFQPKSEPRSAPRRFGLLAASIALAAGIGGMLGAAGFAAVGKLAAEPEKPVAIVQPVDHTAELKELKNQVTLMRSSIKSLSDNVAAPRSGDKALTGQVAKLAEAVERIERSHVDPSQKIAKLGEAVERLERKMAAAPAPAQIQAAAPQPKPAPSNETTGALKANQPTEQARVTSAQVVEGWRLHEVYNGVAVIEGRYGPVEVQAGDDIRGLGRVQTIRRQDGRWVVMTSKGMIVSSR